MKIEAKSRPRMRLFRSDALERLTTFSPRAFALTWLAILSIVLIAGWHRTSLGAAIGLVAAGLFGWTLFEYAMHRFMFHWKTQSRIFRSVVFITHGNHHVDTSDPYRNMMPPIISVPVSAAVWALCLLALGHAGSMLFLGFAIGYVLYDGIHYACHQFPMRGPILKQLRRHHILHHHAKRDGNYAITVILWDRVFGTRIPAKGR
ncbi:fatty acid hydroxylase [Nostoc sp. 3335mG]|nr:fatty acid hydroxylase [Nostoc sp. 3335mG]